MAEARKTRSEGALEGWRGVVRALSQSLALSLSLSRSLARSRAQPDPSWSPRPSSRWARAVLHAQVLASAMVLALGAGSAQPVLGADAAAAPAVARANKVASPAASASLTAVAAPAAVPDPALEARMMAIAAELRCLVCQNQTIADSHAGLALDLRQQIREQLSQGRTEAQITDYMTARYGDFVLYRPPFRASTALLWLGPIVLLVVALGSLWRVLRRRQQLGDEAFDPPAAEDDETVDGIGLPSEPAAAEATHLQHHRGVRP